MRVFRCIRRVDEITRNHHEIEPRLERIQGRHAVLERFGRIDAAVGQLPRRLDVQVGNLRDANLLGRHRISQSSGGKRRTASGAIARPTRSPTLTCARLGASTVNGLLEAPLTTRRCFSPLKATLSITPVSAASFASTSLIASGRTIATAAARLIWRV